MALASPVGDPAPLVTAFTGLRADAAQSVAQAVALMGAKFGLATVSLQQFLGEPRSAGRQLLF